MNNRTNWKLLTPLCVIAMAGALAGCGSDQPGFTKQQEEALRHPQKDSNWKPPGEADLKQEQDSIAAYRQKHASDKVEFTTGH